QAALARCRERLAALPAMQQLIGEARYFDVHRRAPPGRTDTDRPVIATLVRYAEGDAPAAKPKRPAATAHEAKGPAPDQRKIALAYRDRGISYVANGEHGRAILDFNNAIRIDPRDAVAHHNRGLAYAGQGQHARAIEDYSEAIRLDPKDA